jgi:hypothetical protein
MPAMRVEAHRTALLFGGLSVSFYNAKGLGLSEDLSSANELMRSTRAQLKGNNYDRSGSAGLC